MPTNLFSVSLVLLIGFQAGAKEKEEAYIRTNPIKKMVKKEHDRVEGRLTDLDVDDDGPTILCYGGDPDDVCEIIKAAVRQENDKENFDDEHAWKMRECGFGDSGNWWGGLGGYVEFRVIRKRGEMEGHKLKDTITDHMPLCSKLDKIK